MTLKAYEMTAHGDDGNGDPVAGTQYAQPLGRCQDLISVHVEDSEGVGRRRHPRLCPVDPCLFDSDLPAGWGPGNLTAEGVTDHLSSEADAHQLASFSIKPSYQVGQPNDPRKVVINGVSRPGSDPGITLVEIKRELAGGEIECDEFDPGPIGKEASEEVRVVPGDGPETGPNMVAKEETQAHHGRVSRFSIRLVRYPRSARKETMRIAVDAGSGFWRIADRGRSSLLRNEDRLVLAVVLEGGHSLLSPEA